MDSFDLNKHTINEKSEHWGGSCNLPETEEFYKVSVTVFDESDSEQFTIPNATRFTTAGPVVLDSLSISEIVGAYSVRTYILNQSENTTIINPAVKLMSDDPWIRSIFPGEIKLSNIPPGGVVFSPTRFSVKVIDSLYTGYFNFKAIISSDDQYQTPD